MADLLSRLVAQTLGRGEVVQPRVAPLFASEQPLDAPEVLASVPEQEPGAAGTRGDERGRLVRGQGSPPFWLVDRRPPAVKAFPIGWRNWWRHRESSFVGPASARRPPQRVPSNHSPRPPQRRILQSRR